MVTFITAYPAGCCSPELKVFLLPARRRAKVLVRNQDVGGYGATRFDMTVGMTAEDIFAAIKTATQQVGMVIDRSTCYGPHAQDVIRDPLTLDLIRDNLPS